MQLLCGERRTSFTITWLLVGLLLGSVFNSLPAVKGSLVCEEERVLETELEDDDRSESRCLEWALSAQIGDRSIDLAWNDILGFSLAPPFAIEGLSQIIRGPPRC